MLVFAQINLFSLDPVGADAYDCGGPVRVLVSENDAPLAIVATGTPDAHQYVHFETAVNLCALPGGTDAPGTVLHFVAVQVGQPETADREDLVIPDVGDVIGEVVGQFDPAAGTTVSPGQSIQMALVGVVAPPTSGVASISYTTNFGEKGSKTVRSKRPSCADPLNTLRGTAKFVVHVPEDPPPVVTVTASVTTRSGHTPASETWSWPTTQQWTVTFDLEQHSICPETEMGTGTLTVAANGTVQGTTSGNYSDNEDACDAPATAGGSFTGVVSGTFAANQFNLTFGMISANNAIVGLPLTVPLTSPSTASASGTDTQLSSGAGPLYRTYSVTLNRAS